MLIFGDDDDRDNQRKPQGKESPDAPFPGSLPSREKSVKLTIRDGILMSIVCSMILTVLVLFVSFFGHLKITLDHGRTSSFSSYDSKTEDEQKIQEHFTKIANKIDDSLFWLQLLSSAIVLLALDYLAFHGVKTDNGCLTNLWFCALLIKVSGAITLLLHFSKADFGLELYAFPILALTIWTTSLTLITIKKITKLC